MVQRSISDMGSGRPTANASSNDDSNWSQRLSVPEGDSHAVTVHHLQALMEHCDIDEIAYRLSSGAVFQVTRTHPEPREVHNADFLTRQTSRSSADTVEGFYCEGVLSRSGQAHGSLILGRGGPTPKRKRSSSGSPTPTSRNKRKPVTNRRAAMHSDHDSDDEDEIPDELEGAETESVGIRVADVILHYYEIAFRLIGQLCCKDILKAWIRICHPRKQSSHPYNGGKSDNVELSKARYGYLGHFTKPDYWPSDENYALGWGCRHREPDHIKKPERLMLLLYLLRAQNKGFKHGDFSLAKIKKSTEGFKCGKHWTAKSFERLKEIYHIRDLEMQFERGEIDGDTLVYVQMPKPRSKAVRKTPKSLVKAASPTSGQLKREPEDTGSKMCNAPVANMGTNGQLEDEDLNSSEGSEPSIYGDTSSSTEEVAPDKSYAKSEFSDARTTQYGSPFIGSPSPMDRDRVHYPVQENLVSQTGLGRGATVFQQPNNSGYVATLGEAQSLPNQEVPCRRYDHELAAPRRAANRMRPNGRFTRAPASRPVGPKAENTCPKTFVASSTGLAKWFPNYSSWQTNNLWSAQLEPSIYTAGADPSASLVPSTNGSFTSGHNDASFSSGVQWDPWTGDNQMAMLFSQQDFDEEFLQSLNLQRISYPAYQPLDMNAPSGDTSDLANQYPYTANFRPEHKFDPFSQHQRQL